jgi:hypothetical protein
MMKALPVLVAGAWLAILLSDTRLLVSQKLVHPGASYVVEGHGDLGAAGQATLVCRYFNGRQLLMRVLWYSASNVMGRDTCPFLLRD